MGRLPTTSADRLIDLVKGSAAVTRAAKLLRDDGLVNIKSAVGSLKALVVAGFFRDFSQQVAYVCPDFVQSEVVKEEAEILLGADAIAFFPAPDRQRRGLSFSSSQRNSARLSALEALADGEPVVLILNAPALIDALPAPEKFLPQKMSIRRDSDVDFERLTTRLVDFGFVREKRVERSGEISIRGGIVDVFPFSSEQPCRIEFWGNTVESIRRFDPVSQRSLKEVQEIELYPHQFLVSRERAPGEANILDYLNREAIIVLDEPELVRDKVDASLHESVDSELDGPEKKVEHEANGSIFRKMEQRRVANLVSLGSEHRNLIDLGARTQDSLGGNLELFKQKLTALNGNRSSGRNRMPTTTFFLCDNDHQVEQFREIFADRGISDMNVSISALSLHKGFVFPGGNLAVFTDSQFYGRTRRPRLPKKSTPGLSRNQLKYLNRGDFVVHVDFGVGIYRGLKKVKVHGNERECLHLEYRDGDNLYVRLERMDRVHKYSSKDGMQPTLNKLGAPDWQRLKKRTKKKIKDIAQELIELYAKRKAQEGVAFLPDSLWQKELEASFPYEDTPDQLQASEDVKRDMETAKPMDRLVCGDVGFGKTEIAIRAAFKAVLNGRQVAMLVPTTILAYQHCTTFKERLRDFPVEVEMLSRFRTKAQQKQIVDKLNKGQLDIVIGTHRIVSKDVAFKNLGLLIIDEEQRFGVRHKERLKHLRATIDVLTLTATPIPRTLYLSLMGARDISNINTPPKNRLPIQTEILQFNKAYIREVILRELDRGGQVFFVHNKVRTIDRVASMVKALVPEANVAVGHGQMEEKDLERVMMGFMKREHQILVSTMIIESGLDMPNVNTIVVDRADKFGLAQLYQLRGRVGRSHHRAYAYLLIPPIENLTEDALKRLRALEEFSDIGSGGQLAMRDLEIRGAGNLLGAEQSGYIDTLGFDLYNKILEEAVKELREERNPDETGAPEIDTQVELDSDAFLPDDFIESGADRVDFYRRLTEAGELQQLREIRQEIRDRFGRLPDPVNNLLGLFALRLVGQSLGLKSVRVQDQEMLAEFAAELSESKGEPFKNWLGSMVVNANSNFEFIQNEGIGIRLNVPPETEDKYMFLIDFLESLKSGGSGHGHTMEQ